MKIVFLNAWSAELRGPLTAFLRQQMPDTDVFCFQEAEGAMVEVCAELFAGYYAITRHKPSTDDTSWQATYVRDGIDVRSSGAILEEASDSGLAVYVQLELAGRSVYVCNFHGTSRPIDKRDTPGRQRQTQAIADFFADKDGVKIVGGDFNVFPDNGSLQVIRDAGYRDLIQEYSITNTRNHFVWDRYPQNPRQYYSDYVFVSGDVQVQTFAAPDPEISDHTPLLLSVSL